MADIVELLRTEANATEELHPEDSEIEVMRTAANEIERLRKAIGGARAQLYAVHSVDQVPFLKGAIGAALQVLEC